MITMKDYAEKKKISYEAVRKQVSRYSEELKGHVRKEKGVSYLDETAEKFLDERRASNPVVIMDTRKEEKIEELQETVEKLQAEKMGMLQKIVELQQAIIESQKKTELALTESKQLLERLPDLEKVEQYKGQIAEQEKKIQEQSGKLAERAERIEQQAGQIAEQSGQIRSQTEQIAEQSGKLTKAEEQIRLQNSLIEELQQAKTEAEQQAGAFVKTWFGLYRKQ